MRCVSAVVLIEARFSAETFNLGQWRLCSYLHHKPGKRQIIYFDLFLAAHKQVCLTALTAWDVSRRSFTSCVPPNRWLAWLCVWRCKILYTLCHRPLVCDNESLLMTSETFVHVMVVKWMCTERLSRVGNTASHLGGLWFKSRLGYRLSWLRLSCRAGKYRDSILHQATTVSF
jgi:hypothetical protein